MESVSELTSENIFSNLSNLMDRPISVSTTMAHDTLLRSFLEEEAQEGYTGAELQTIQSYLSSYQNKYAYDSVFLVSNRTKNYYHYKNGVDRVLSPTNAEDTWYYNFLKDSADCSLNVDNDQAEKDNITIFINCKVYDANNQVLGVIGVGMVTPYIQQYLKDNKNRFDVQSYLIDQEGNIQVSSDYTKFENVNLFQNAAFSDMAEAIDTKTSDSNRRWYRSSTKDGYVITRYIPNLNWYLVVEKNTQEFSQKMRNQVIINFGCICIILISILFLASRILKKYDFKLKTMAEKDSLTGIRNRTSYENEMEKYSIKLNEYESFGLGVCDLNNLKAVNDKQGHQAGDDCIKEFSSKLCATFKHCPVFRIGGDEFVIVFLNQTEDNITIHWNALCEEIKKEKENKTGSPISAAFGVAFYDTKKNNNISKIFKEADSIMYENKLKSKQNRQE